MRRGFVLLLLLTSLFWQSLTMAGQVAALAHGEDFSHTVLHWLDSAHHHHDDGTVHADPGDDALQHIALDGALQTAALLPSLLVTASATGHVFLPMPQERGQPPPWMEGPTRPPRALA